MSKQLTISVAIVVSFFFFIHQSSSLQVQSSNVTVKRNDDYTPSNEDIKERKEIKGETMVKAAATSHRKSINGGLRKPSTITIPIKNAVVQALSAVDRNEAEAAHHSPSRHSGELEGALGEIIYEDELPGELGEWIPPPPPPPEHLLSHRPSYSPAVPASTFQRLTGIARHPGSSARLFGDDFALFLVILTIAGFFGLMLAMFMPFTFLLQQQPLSVTPYPTGQYGSYGQYGYPYGRRRRRRRDISQSIAWSRASEMGLADLLISSFFKALTQYEKLNNRLNTVNSYKSYDSFPLSNSLGKTPYSPLRFNSVKFKTKG